MTRKSPALAKLLLPSGYGQEHRRSTMAKSVGGSKKAQAVRMSSKRDKIYTIGRRARFWEVVDAAGQLVCLTVYKRGAKEVVRRLSS